MKPVKLAMYGKGRSSWMDYRDTLNAFDAFDGSPSFYGRPVDSGQGVYIHMGQMPTDERDNFRAVGPDIDYVVYSYVTPIAWHVAGVGWFRTSAGHSNTTKRHMGKLCGLEFVG